MCLFCYHQYPFRYYEEEIQCIVLVPDIVHMHSIPQSQSILLEIIETEVLKKIFQNLVCEF